MPVLNMRHYLWHDDVVNGQELRRSEETVKGARLTCGNLVTTHPGGIPIRRPREA